MLPPELSPLLAAVVPPTLAMLENGLRSSCEGSQSLLGFATSSAAISDFKVEFSLCATFSVFAARAI